MGITLPMFSINKFIIFNDEFSLLGGLLTLLSNKEVFLFLLIFLFSIVMPLCKFIFSFNYIFNTQSSLALKTKQAKMISAIGKWSMADVFVISVLAATIKVGGMAKVNIHIGLLFFGLSVLLSLILSKRIMSNYELIPKQNTYEQNKT